MKDKRSPRMMRAGACETQKLTDRKIAEIDGLRGEREEILKVSCTSSPRPATGPASPVPKALTLGGRPPFVLALFEGILCAAS